MKNSQIQWTDHTYSPWWGCTRVSEGCKNCYAAQFGKRTGRAKWERGAPRWRPSRETLLQPEKWNAARHYRRMKVFCASMSDVFDAEVPCAWRHELWSLVHRCSNLDWLLLTKRPENISSMLPDWWTGQDLGIWLGTTVENQRRADERIPILREVPCAVRFLSVEPLLGPVELDLRGIHWVICGGESGPGYRLMHPDWARSVRDQCSQAGVPFFFKQWCGLHPKKLGRLLDGREWNEFPILQS